VSSLTITTRHAKDGARYVVRYRLGGRAYPIVHAGSFRTLKEAKARRDFVAGELAAGRNPVDAMRSLVEQSRWRTLREWSETYTASRVDFAEQTKINMQSHLKLIVDALGDRDPATITPADVQEWIGGLTLKAVIYPEVRGDVPGRARLCGRRPQPRQRWQGQASA
jgi:hypothetical protein